MSGINNHKPIISKRAPAANKNNNKVIFFFDYNLKYIESFLSKNS
jgi:hypothetical protein